MRHPTARRDRDRCRPESTPIATRAADVLRHAFVRRRLRAEPNATAIAPSTSDPNPSIGPTGLLPVKGNCCPELPGAVGPPAAVTGVWLSSLPEPADAVVLGPFAGGATVEPCGTTEVGVTGWPDVVTVVSIVVGVAIVVSLGAVVAGVVSGVVTGGAVVTGPPAVVTGVAIVVDVVGCSTHGFTRRTDVESPPVKPSLQRVVIDNVIVPVTLPGTIVVAGSLPSAGTTVL